MSEKITNSNLSSDMDAEQVILGMSSFEPKLGNRVIQRQYKLEIPESVLRKAKVELIEKHNAHDAKFTPGRESEIEVYPGTNALSEWLADGIFEPSKTDLTFIRATRRRDNIYADNLHFDSRYVGYSKRRNVKGTFWRPSNRVEIWRQIVNLNDEPRHLQIINTPIGDLEKRGIDIYAERPVGREVEGYERPEDIPLGLLVADIPTIEAQVCTIPAYDGVNLPVLELWSSRVLHAGITSRHGQFMAVSAKWVEPDQRDKGGYYAR